MVRSDCSGGCCSPNLQYMPHTTTSLTQLAYTDLVLPLGKEDMQSRVGHKDGETSGAFLKAARHMKPNTTRHPHH